MSMITRWTVVFGAILASATAFSSDSFSPKSVPKHDAKVFFENVSYVGNSFSSDGSQILLSSDASGVFNVMILFPQG